MNTNDETAPKASSSESTPERTEADYRSLRGELATIFGPVKPHHGMSWNASMLARIAEVLSEKDLGRPATKENINEDLDVYGNAFIYHGRLLEPVELVIKMVKGKFDEKAPANYEVVRRVGLGQPWPKKTAEEEAMNIVKDFHAMYVKDGKAKEPPMDFDGITRDAMALVALVKRANLLIEGKELEMPHAPEDHEDAQSG